MGLNHSNHVLVRQATHRSAAYLTEYQTRTQLRMCGCLATSWYSQDHDTVAVVTGSEV